MYIQWGHPSSFWNLNIHVYEHTDFIFASFFYIAVSTQETVRPIGLLFNKQGHAKLERHIIIPAMDFNTPTRITKTQFC